MDEYIEKAELIKKLCFETAEWYYSPTIKTIKEFPSSDVQSVKHGRWTRIDDKYGHDYVCSVCNNKNDRKSHYCPDCGARMDGDSKC